VKVEFSLLPVAAFLAEALGRDVVLADEPAGDGVKKVVNDLRDGGVAMLENLRFTPGEEANDENFSRALASYADVYVNDAFGTAHRAHASTVGMVKYVSSKGMGFLMDRETKMLGKLLGEVQRPFVAIIGGAKVSDKIGLLESLLGRADAVCLGGAMANTFLCAKGASMGHSLVESSKLPIARAFLAKAETSGVQIVLPRDLVVAEDAKAAAGTVVSAMCVPNDQAALDIGPESVSDIGAVLSRARTVFWNGPMGVFEEQPFASGTIAVAMAIALVIGGTTVVCGDDSAAAVHRAGVASSIAHISTSGSAALEFIEGKKLPGLAALES
jgi:phosphoglycerate kinase